MIPDEVGGIGLVLLGLRIDVEVRDGYCIGVQSPLRNGFLFQQAVYAVCSLLYLLMVITSVDMR